MANYEIAEAAMLASDRYNDMLILTDADSISLLEQFGLMLDAGYPQIGRAEALSMLVHVPGSGRPWNLSPLSGRQAALYQAPDHSAVFLFSPKSAVG